MSRKRRKGSNDGFSTTILKKKDGRWKMISSLEKGVLAIAKLYRQNPLAMAKALTELLKNELERSAKESEAQLALRKCEKLHPAGCDQVVCLACAKSDKFRSEASKENEDDL